MARFFAREMKIGCMKEIIFKNREQAAISLAHKLEEYKEDPKAIVIGVPKGGVEIAYHVAHCLGLPMCTIISKRLSFPGNKEFGFGALAEEDFQYVLPDARKVLGEDLVEQAVEKGKMEVARRVALYREGEPLPDLAGRTVIIVDDGVATGVTLVPVIKLCRNRGAGKIVIAAPVASPRYDWRLDDADELVFVQQPYSFLSVGHFYHDYSPLQDEKVIHLLRQKCNLKPN